MSPVCDQVLHRFARGLAADLLAVGVYSLREFVHVVWREVLLDERAENVLLTDTAASRPISVDGANGLSEAIAQALGQSSEDGDEGIVSKSGPLRRRQRLLGCLLLSGAPARCGWR